MVPFAGGWCEDTDPSRVRNSEPAEEEDSNDGIRRGENRGGVQAVCKCSEQQMFGDTALRQSSVRCSRCEWQETRVSLEEESAVRCGFAVKCATPGKKGRLEANYLQRI